MPNTRLILHVKGTESETAELPKDVVRAAISQGQITHSQLIWSPGHNTWKQVREIPDLLPEPETGPIPIPAGIGTVAKVKVLDVIIPKSPTSPIARVAAAASAPRPVKVASAEARPAGKASAVKKAASAPAHSSTKHLTIQDAEDPHWLRWLCIGMGTFVFLILGINYSLVHQPLVANMSQTPYANVPVYAHYGAFMQPNVMVIHIPPSKAITADNLTDFLAALAYSTPKNPITGEIFDRVALTSAWTTEYSVPGKTWKEFGAMKHETRGNNKGKDNRRDFLLDQMGDSSGQSLAPESTLSEESQQNRRKLVWADFVAHFDAQHGAP